MSQFVATGPQKFATFTADQTGDNEVVAAVAGKKIRVLSVYGLPSDDLNLTIKSDTGGSAVAKSGVMPLVAPNPYNPNPRDGGLFETDAGKALNFNISANALTGHLVYQEVL